VLVISNISYYSVFPPLHLAILKLKYLFEKGLVMQLLPQEYAVKMKEIPQRFRMDNLLAANKVSLKTVDKLTEILVQFHHSAQTNDKIKRFGCPIFMKKKVQENFNTLRKLALLSSTATTTNSIFTIDPKFEKRLISFIGRYKKLFYRRLEENRVRDIHGDLYLKNIFILHNKLYLYDRIEFNDSLRYADIAEDVAHLCMTLIITKEVIFGSIFFLNILQKVLILI
jgi:aminoglycoside phosphotransferase family enzyme